MMYNFTTTTVIGNSLLDINDRVIVDTDTIENNNFTILNYLCLEKSKNMNTLKQNSVESKDSTSTYMKSVPQLKS